MRSGWRGAGVRGLRRPRQTPFCLSCPASRGEGRRRSRGLGGGGQAGRAAGPPAPRAAALPGAPGLRPGPAARASSGRRLPGRGAPGTLAAAAAAPRGPAEAGQAGTRAGGAAAAGVRRNAAPSPGKVSLSIWRGRARRGRKRREEAGPRPLGRARLPTLVLASEASLRLSRERPPPGRRKGGRKEQGEETGRGGGERRGPCGRSPSRGSERGRRGPRSPAAPPDAPQARGAGRGAGAAGPRRSPRPWARGQRRARCFPRRGPSSRAVRAEPVPAGWGRSHGSRAAPAAASPPGPGAAARTGPPGPGPAVRAWAARAPGAPGGSAGPPRRPPDRARPGGLGDRPGGALQRRHEPQDGQRAADRAHEAPEAARLLLQASRAQIPLPTGNRAARFPVSPPGGPPAGALGGCGLRGRRRGGDGRAQGRAGRGAALLRSPRPRFVPPAPGSPSRRLQPPGARFACSLLSSPAGSRRSRGDSRGGRGGRAAGGSHNTRAPRTSAPAAGPRAGAALASAGGVAPRAPSPPGSPGPPSLPGRHGVVPSLAIVEQSRGSNRPGRSRALCPPPPPGSTSPRGPGARRAQDPDFPGSCLWSWALSPRPFPLALCNSRRLTLPETQWAHVLASPPRTIIYSPLKCF